MDNKIDLPRKIEILKAQHCFSQLMPSELETLASLLKEVNLSKGRTIVTEGESVDSVYFIIKGTADVQHVRLKDGAPQIELVATLKEGETIGLNESGFYSLTGLRTATVVASSDMLLLRLSVAAFHGFALAYPHVNEVMRANARSFLGLKS